MLSPILWPLNHALKDQVQKLRAAIDGLFLRLRDSIVHAVSEAVSGTVRKTLRAVLSNGDAPRLLDDYQPHRPARSLWGREERDEWYDELQEPLDEIEELEADFHPAASSPEPRRLHSALAAGFQIAAWSLRQAAGISTAIGAGVLTAATALVGSPLLAAGVGLLSAFAGLMSLNTIHTAGSPAGFFGH